MHKNTTFLKPKTSWNVNVYTLLSIFRQTCALMWYFQEISWRNEVFRRNTEVSWWFCPWEINTSFKSINNFHMIIKFYTMHQLHNIFIYTAQCTEMLNFGRCKDSLYLGQTIVQSCLKKVDRTCKHNKCHRHWHYRIKVTTYMLPIWRRNISWDFRRSTNSILLVQNILECILKYKV